MKRHFFCNQQKLSLTMLARRSRFKSRFCVLFIQNN